jgi:hypothetical protein
MTSPVYEQLLEGVTEELERKVLDILLQSYPETSAGITRQQFVLALFGYWPNNLGSDPCDRIIRKAIEHLRQEWPIVSSSGGAGYRLSEDDNEIKAFAAEQEARADKIRKDARAAFRWLPKARAIREMRRSNLTVTQLKLI